MKWIKVTDEMPESGTDNLVWIYYCRDRGLQTWKVIPGCYYNGDWFSCWSRDIIGDVICWMKITKPEPPQEAKGGGG